MCTDNSNRIHLFGASGSGVTTIGKEIAQKLSILHIDSDDFGWEDTNPPFKKRNPIDKRIELLRAQTETSASWILSGSLWTRESMFSFPFTLVVFLYLNTEERVNRLEKREIERYGSKVLPGGIRYNHSRQFLEWAASYDDGPMNERSLQLHESWITNPPCPTLRVVTNKSVQCIASEVLSFVHT